MDTNNLKNMLIDANIKPTFQRLKILEYLNLNHTHPTVDEIYINLCPIIPTLSKTTVYNTLKSFVKAKIVDEIKIENTEIRYDIVTDPHGHFKCKKCGTIYNFNFPYNLIDSEELKDFEIDSKNVYLSGTCPKCQEIEI
ncbi:MAG: Fur family transcriptional regulator [Miniphocaeibacter sp.]|uniref:Fur family transcriptional regulator n=1 Tax=Miniphocaeibacter sp. TaxID=3100973 RepID=UPI0017DF006F|nr:transcriptional repressor [Gallicola sp.]